MADERLGLRSGESGVAQDLLDLSDGGHAAFGEHAPHLSDQRLGVRRESHDRDLPQVDLLERHDLLLAVPLLDDRVKTDGETVDSLALHQRPRLARPLHVFHEESAFGVKAFLVLAHQRERPDRLARPMLPESRREPPARLPLAQRSRERTWSHALAIRVNDVVHARVAREVALLVDLLDVVDEVANLTPHLCHLCCRRVPTTHAARREPERCCRTLYRVCRSETCWTGWSAYQRSARRFSAGSPSPAPRCACRYRSASSGSGTRRAPGCRRAATRRD